MLAGSVLRARGCAPGAALGLETSGQSPNRGHSPPGWKRRLPARHSLAAHRAAKPELLIQKSERCHGLVPWSITLVATPPLTHLSGCHGLVPWSITLIATPIDLTHLLDATGLSRGV